VRALSLALRRSTPFDEYFPSACSSIRRSLDWLCLWWLQLSKQWEGHELRRRDPLLNGNHMEFCIMWGWNHLGCHVQWLVEIRSFSLATCCIGSKCRLRSLFGGGV